MWFGLWDFEFSNFGVVVFLGRGKRVGFCCQVSAMAVAVRGARAGVARDLQTLLGSMSVRSISSSAPLFKDHSADDSSLKHNPLKHHNSKSSSASDLTGEEEIVKPKERKKLLVLGGNGFVGSHVCMEALARGVPVVSLNRTGRPNTSDSSWTNNVVWVRGDLFDPSRWEGSLDEVQSVISCVGGFGTNEQMRRINGEANRSAVWAASKAGVKKFVYVSIADFGLPPFVLPGYFEGKKMAEDAVRSKFPYSGVILRPGFIYGTRKFGGVNLPLGIIGTPLETVMTQAKVLSQIPLIGPLFVPPVNVEAVAKAAVKAALGPVPPGVMDVWSIIRLGSH